VSKRTTISQSGVKQALNSNVTYITYIVRPKLSTMNEWKEKAENVWLFEKTGFNFIGLE
jgi:hypothetical protein